MLEIDEFAHLDGKTIVEDGVAATYGKFGFPLKIVRVEGGEIPQEPVAIDPS